MIMYQWQHLLSIERWVRWVMRRVVLVCLDLARSGVRQWSSWSHTRSHPTLVTIITTSVISTPADTEWSHWHSLHTDSPAVDERLVVMMSWEYQLTQCGVRVQLLLPVLQWSPTLSYHTPPHLSHLLTTSKHSSISNTNKLKQIKERSLSR